MVSTLKLEATHIIHCAWAVNFALSVQSFLPQIQALHNLLSLSFSAKNPEPAHFLFCSSVGTASATPTPAVITEAPIPSLQHTTPTGYAQSKMVGERIVEAAVEEAGARATILRIGQIVPARSRGSQLWNQNEAIPLMIRSAITVGALPDALGANGQDLATWLEADVLAEAITEIAGIGARKDDPNIDTSQLVYNLVHPRPFSWREEFLPALKSAGLEFETVPWEDWVRRLASSETDVEKNPSRKLLGFWERRAQEKSSGKKGSEVHFETKRAEAASGALRRADRVVDGDMVEKLLKNWRQIW
jgi:thioester reductase-like protein